MHRRPAPRALFGALAITLAALFAAPTLATAEPMQLKVATIAPKATPWGKLLYRIKKAFKKAAPGELKVRDYYGGALGGEKDLVSRCQQGGLGMIGVTTGALATVVPELNVLELPYLWKSERQVDKALAGPLGEALTKALEAKGFVLYAWAENGFRQFATSTRFIEKPDDLKGLRMRAQPSYVHTSMYKAFGASPNPIPAPDVPGALSAGTVEGYDNSLLYAFATQWYSSIKFLTVSKHIYQPAAMVFCKKVYDKIPEATKPKLYAKRDKIEKGGRSMVRKGNKGALDGHRNAGVQILDKQPNRGAFQAKAKAVWAEFAKKTPEGDKLLALAKKAAGL